MIKVIAVIKGRSDLSREDFLRYWRDEHPHFVRQLPGILRYCQNPAIEHHKKWPFDGAAELWFDSVKDVAAAFDSEAAIALRAHEKHFISEIVWFLANEHEVPIGQEDA